MGLGCTAAQWLWRRWGDRCAWRATEPGTARRSFWSFPHQVRKLILPAATRVRNPDDTRIVLNGPGFGWNDSVLTTDGHGSSNRNFDANFANLRESRDF